MGEEPRCPLREIGRRFGVSHTYDQKLVREFLRQTQQDAQAAAQYKVWIGRLESRTYDFNLRQW